MTSIEQLGLETVVNKQEFQSSVVIKECPIVGRSLVAKKPLVPGDIVLVEEPLIQYDLEPKCRSNKSPYYSKKIWKILKNMVYAEEGIDTQLNIQQPNESDESDESEDDMEETTVHSDFYPGVPAAIVAYSFIHPPPSYSNARRRKEYSQNDFDFFYFPNTDIEPAWLDHKTIKLIHTVTQKVVDTVPLYAHVDPFDLRSFVLKIYSNAHTVSLPRIRTAPTHASRRSRREKYKAKFGETTYWGEDAVEPPNTPTIALLRWGSKFAHSCSPNMFLRFEPQRNAMVFTVTKPLAEGDILSFSYLPEDDSTVGGLVYGATPDRQAKLEKFKFFKCACERCLDWDWTRGADCPDCQGTAYCDCQGIWTCFACGSHNQPSFVGEREKQVENTVMGFVSRIYGGRITQHTMRILEPYLTDLLEQGVPKHHWLYAVIHSLLATYHLALFPQSYGKGLASQLGLTVKGLEESLVYLEFLDTIYAPKHPQATYTGNAMAAFFASWRILSVVVDLVMTSTEDKYAHSDSDEPVLIPLAQDWIQPVTRMSNIVDKEWIPLVEQVFRSHAVVQDMIKQIKAFSQRIHL